MNGGLTLNTPNGGQTIIDGTSNMFKIYNAYYFDFWTSQYETATSQALYHGLGYVPAFIAYQVDTPASIRGNIALPALSISGASYENGMRFVGIIRCTADQEYIYVESRQSPGVDGYFLSNRIKAKVFVLKEGLV